MDGRPLWRLERGWAFGKSEQDKLATFVPKELRLLGRVYPTDKLYDVKMEEMGWRWVYVGDERSVQTGTGSGKIQFGKGVRFPDRKVLAEEPLLGYWERYLLGMLNVGSLKGGGRDVWRWAGERDRERAVGDGVLAEVTNEGGRENGGVNGNGAANGGVNGVNGVKRNETVNGSQNGNGKGVNGTAANGNGVNGSGSGNKGHKATHSVG